MVAIAGDRPVSDLDDAIPFFGRPARVPSGHVRLALQAGAPVIVGYSPRLAETGRPTLHLDPPLEMIRTGNREEEVRINMQRVLQALEAPIRRWPDQWQMFVPVWPECLSRRRQRVAQRSMEMRTLITGGAGFLGATLANRLVGQGHTVLVLDDLTAGDPRRLDAGVLFNRGDVKDVPKLWTLLQGVDCVYHLAARVRVPESVHYPSDYNAVNVGGTVAVMEAMRDTGVRRVVFASSGALYGEQAHQPIEESQSPNPNSPYGVSKIAAEYYVSTLGALYGIETVALRIFNVYGPGQELPPSYPPVIPHLLQADPVGRIAGSLWRRQPEPRLCVRGGRGGRTVGGGDGAGRQPGGHQRRIGPGGDDQRAGGTHSAGDGQGSRHPIQPEPAERGVAAGGRRAAGTAATGLEAADRVGGGVAMHAGAGSAILG